MAGATRDVFEHLPEEAVVLFYVLTAITLAVFFFGLWLRVRKYRSGRGGYRFTLAGFPGRLGAAIWTIAKHTTIGRDDAYVRISHFLTFWGFAALFAATAILTLDNDIARRFWPPGFWHGTFFLGYEFGADLGGVALVVGVLMLMVRRWVLRPFRLSYRRVDLPPERYDRGDYSRGDALFLVVLLGLGLSGFLLEGARLVADHPDYPTSFSFAGAAVAVLLRAGGLASGAAETLRLVTWWSHALFALAFVAYLPYGKGVHMFLDPATLVLRDELAGRRLPAAGGA